VIATAGGHDRIDDGGETSPDMKTAVTAWAAGTSLSEAHISASMSFVFTKLGEKRKTVKIE